MDESLNENRRGGRGKRPAPHPAPLSSASGEAAVATNPPCGACKFLRRKCISGCIFAPHFGSDQGGARFAAVHKVFGASNVSKLLMHIPENRRGDAVVTISYEAQARLSDPVYGCVSTIVALQQQVQSLQAELCLVQNQLITGRFAMANSIQNSQQQHIAMMQPVYSNASSGSNNFLNMNSFSSNFGETPGPSNSFEPNIHHIAPPVQDDEEEETHDPAMAFANQIFP